MRGTAAVGFLELRFVSRLKHGCPCLVSVVRCQVEASALGWSLVQKSSTECVVTECDPEASIMKKGYGLLGTVAPWERGNLQRIDCKDGTFVGLTVDSA